MKKRQLALVSHPKPKTDVIPIKWGKDKASGLCYVVQSSNCTSTFFKSERPPLRDILGRVILYAAQCRERYQKGVMDRLEPSDIARVFPELVFPDHLLQEIIDAPNSITPRQLETKFYAELTNRPETSILRDMTGGKR